MCLAAPGLADQTEGLTRPDRDAHVGQRVHVVASLAEHLREVGQLEKRRAPGVDRRKLQICGFLARELVRALVVPAATRVGGADVESGGSSVRHRSSASAQRSAKTQPGSPAETREEARDRVEPAVILADAAARDAPKESDRVRVTRILEDVSTGPSSTSLPA